MEAWINERKLETPWGHGVFSLGKEHMKQKLSLFLVLVLLCSIMSGLPVFAVGEGNIDGGGGGMGQGTSQNSWLCRR